MTNIQVAIGLAQLEKIDKLVEMRKRNARAYEKFLRDVEGTGLPVEKDWAKNVYWMYSILIEDKFGISRDGLVGKLTEKGIETRPCFIPMHEQPAFQRMGLFKRDISHRRRHISKGLYLPPSSGLKEEEVRYISETIKELSKRN